MTEGGRSAAFTYNGDGARVKMNVSDGATSVLSRYYIGNQYELDVTPNGTTERLYLGGDAYSAPAVYVKEGSGTWTFYNIGRDYLGNITHIATSDGTLVEENSYDPWGRLRNPETKEIYSLGTEPELMLGRGYTGHEHLTWFGLINMNARLYDPVLGRFLSPDPFVQMPDFTQNFNRYSYCLNNPLVYVDENGELTSVKFELFSRYSTKYRSSGNAYNYDEVYEYPDLIDDYVDEKYLEFTIIDSIYKDNGEILQYDLQFNFMGKDDVVLGTAIGRYNAIADLSSQSSKTNSREDATNLTNLKIYYSTNERYNKGDTSPKGTYNSALKLDATTMIKWQSGILENAIKVSTYSNGQYLNVDTSTWKSWCIATENDELIMAVNRNETTNILSDTIYVTTD